MIFFIRRRQLPSGKVRYYVIGEENHRQHGYGGYGYKKEAEARLRQVRDYLIQDMAGLRESTFADFAEKWLTEYAKPNVSQRTCWDYRKIVEGHLIPAFGEKMLAAITTEEIQEFVARQAREGKVTKIGSVGQAPGTVNKQLVLLKAIFERAIEWRYLKQNPARYVKRLKQPHYEMDYYRPEEVERFLQVTAYDSHLLLSVALFTGMRMGEIMGLRWGDIDLKKKVPVLHVRRSYSPMFGFTEPKSAAGRRTIYITPLLATMFQEAGIAKSPEDLVFTTADGQPLTPDHIRDYYFFPTCARADLRRIRFHDLRHTYAAMMIEIGASPKLLQEQLGHDSIDTTYRHYGHLMPSVSEGIGQRLEERMDAAREKVAQEQNVIPFRPPRQREPGI